MDGFKLIIKKHRNNLGSALNRSRLKNERFTIISDDCWGGEVYKDLKLAYSSPFVGMFIMPKCYIKMLSNFDSHMRQPLIFTRTSAYENLNEWRISVGIYPIGLLGDIELHFLHANSQQEAAEKWRRRTERIVWDRLFIKMSGGKNGFSSAELEAFANLQFANKVCFVTTPSPEISCSIYIPNSIPDGARMFRRSLCYFDVVKWLNEGDGSISYANKLINKVMYARLT